METGSVAAGGTAVEVLASYGPFCGFTLHSLAEPVTLDCALCGQAEEVTLIATRGDTVSCPRCYARAAACGRTADNSPGRGEDRACRDAGAGRCPRLRGGQHGRKITWVAIDTAEATSSTGDTVGE